MGKRGNLRKRDNLVESGVNERIILRRIFWMWVGVAWTGLICLRTVTVDRRL
jgi:hypothetical protein